METIGKAIAILLLGYAVAAAQLPSSCCDDMSVGMSGDCLTVGCYDCIVAPSAALPSHAHPVHAVSIEHAPAAMQVAQFDPLTPEVPIPPPKS